jgi:hypothetical protein
MRVAMYLLSVLAQDEETQRKGCVGIFINMKPFRRPVDQSDWLKLANLMGNLAPIRYLGYHFCEDDSQQTVSSRIETLLSAAASQFDRLRFRFHSGTSTRELDLGLGFTWFASISILTYSSILFLKVHY